MFALRYSRVDLMKIQTINKIVQTSPKLHFRLFKTSHIPDNVVKFLICPIHLLQMDKSPIHDSGEWKPLPNWKL